MTLVQMDIPERAPGKRGRSCVYLRGLFCALCVCCGVCLVDGADGAPAEPETAVVPPWDDKRYYDLLTELRCLVCQNQSLADSDASLAGDLREQVRRMMTEGASDDEIKAFMTERYGDFVLYDPPLKPHTYVLWWAPLFILVLVLLLLARTVVGRAKKQS